MATADEYFTHLLQAYGSFKGGDPASRREVASKVVEFLTAEARFVDFEPVPEPEDAPEMVDPTMQYADEAEVALD